MAAPDRNVPDREDMGAAADPDFFENVEDELANMMFNLRMETNEEVRREPLENPRAEMQHRELVRANAIQGGIELGIPMEDLRVIVGAGERRRARAHGPDEEEQADAPPAIRRRDDNVPVRLGMVVPRPVRAEGRRGQGRKRRRDDDDEDEEMPERRR